MKYVKTVLNNGKWVITEAGRDYERPAKAVTFAIDTETQTYFDGKILDAKKLFKRIRNLKTEEKRKRISTVTWAWQCYDEYNGFFMTNDFEEFLTYQCRAGLKFGWCYNSTFDFAQIDFQILGEGSGKWKLHDHKGGKGYSKGQPWTYESIHSDMGARYAYKLWVPYKNADRHTYVHAVEYRDFMKFITGGLRKLLEDLDVRDNEGNPVRKLQMEYQAVNSEELTDSEIDYCANDVKGLYFAIKKFDKTIEEQSSGECRIFGEKTNLMTAGGFAKRELLRSLYPEIKEPKKRIKAYQREHPLTLEQDNYIRENHLYRGGISFVNPHFKGKLLTAKEMGQTMKRYDVNSEYPYSMAMIDDLVGKPLKMTLREYDKMPNKSEYECVLVLTSAFGTVKPGMLGVWYDPFRKEFVTRINESGTHLIFERELKEMQNWYSDLEYTCEKVILWKKGGKRYSPFVLENYKLKDQAKKDKNKTLQQTAKLKLNSSYGKLAERLERIKGHYELSKDTGAVHFVRDEAEVSGKSAMNVAVGALVTSFARCYILGKIREICKCPAKEFVYIDTDSIHAFASYDKADAFKLGGLKLEAECEAVKYIAPKTYIDIEKVSRDGTVNFQDFEIHSKGISIKAIMDELSKKQKGKRKGLPTLRLLDDKISYGRKFICLCAMNVRGGKALIPTEKYLARPELAPKGDERQVLTNYEINMYSEI